ncbi:SDR family oxidoreductase [Parvularcula sp. ZS-1/3]|uniref:SDR family oxidoreductase n=1 Tax=Parvularcula mediterranea TaxID=2732508 RepID=A0A7Y3W3N1_9PROT|nr:SDR family oxidoreductase [Parvularcula mediterranea]NNU14930.1 SDR family oxidoreductase [Parvularcula mediterranea]
MDLGIKGRTALITGGAGTMGRAVAELLIAEGCQVILTDIDEDDVQKTAQELGNGTVGFAADLSTKEGSDAFAKKIDQSPDILVHAAGITGAKGDPLEIDEEDYMHALQIDFLSGVRLAKDFVPGMAERGWGRVVYVTSENVAQSYPDEVVYNSAKSALLSFAKGLSMPYAKKGVLVNAVAPAFIETNMTDGMMEQRMEKHDDIDSMEEAVETFLEEERPYLTLGRRGRPEEVAAAIAFLCSERASFVVGSNYRVDGGAVASLDI